MGISMCALYGRLTEQHMLTACETDVLGSLAMLTNYQAAMGETRKKRSEAVNSAGSRPLCLPEILVR